MWIFIICVLIGASLAVTYEVLRRRIQRGRRVTKVVVVDKYVEKGHAIYDPAIGKVFVFRDKYYIVQDVYLASGRIVQSEGIVSKSLYEDIQVGHTDTYEQDAGE